MNQDKVHIRELAAWGFDPSEYRPESKSERVSRACAVVTKRPPFKSETALVYGASLPVESLIASQALRTDLAEEMYGLDWSLGFVDIQRLIAFQRRLVLDSKLPVNSVPDPGDDLALIHYSFAPPKPVIYSSVLGMTNTSLLLQTMNPNVHFRPSRCNTSPMVLHGGSPFFEVAHFKGRWFLRDGYHRAFALLRANIHKIPAVIVQAQTLEELGAAHPWFYSEDILFSQSPPLVSDFADDDLVLEYDRPRLLKRLCVTIEETFAPATD